jgi:threonine/homoserine/homoserine lactone efflux protein
MLGILIAAPVGPVNVICIQRAIERGTIAGILAGLGAVIGDGLIALLAALGVGQISGTIARYRHAIQIIGGLVLMGFGLKLMFSTPRPAPAGPGKTEWRVLRDGLWDIPQTFVLTVTNPGAVLGLVAIFGGISSFVDVGSTRDALWLVLFIVVGSMFWWVFLAAMVGRIRHRVTEERLRMINVVAGVLLVAFGAVLTAEIALKTARLL